MEIITAALLNLDFHAIQSFTAPNGTVWHVFVADDEDSWWHEEPVRWEIFVAEIGGPSIPSPRHLHYVCGTLLSPGVFVRTEREWAAALERLLPRGEGMTGMEEVD